MCQALRWAWNNVMNKKACMIPAPQSLWSSTEANNDIVTEVSPYALQYLLGPGTLKELNKCLPNK